MTDYTDDYDNYDIGPPVGVVKAWIKECLCCPNCWQSPCDGVRAGGLCDNMPCDCDEDELYDEDH